MPNTLTLVSFITVLAIIALSWAWLFYYPLWRRNRLLATAFPAQWLAYTRRAVPFYDRLQVREQDQLRDLIRLFIADKTYYGCAGLEITDEIRLVVAAQACLLLLNRPNNVYPDLQHILVYPAAFRAVHKGPGEDGTYSDVPRGLLGESWHNGKVILSWDDVEKGIADFHDGHNVVLHEFAHQLDTEAGSANGAPRMSHSSLKTWAQVFSKEFEQLNSAAEGHHHAVMDYYGATNPAEFFAVATETFFEKPQQLEKLHPQLFAELSRFYQTDPRQWQ